MAKPQDDPLVMDIRIVIRNKERYMDGGLELSEQHEIGVGSFLEASNVLGQFHELAQKLKART